MGCALRPCAEKCNYPAVDGTHRCIGCGEHMHAFCGTTAGDGDSEGHGAQRRCSSCSDAGGAAGDVAAGSESDGLVEDTGGNEGADEHERGDGTALTEEEKESGIAPIKAIPGETAGLGMAQLEWSACSKATRYRSVASASHSINVFAFNVDNIYIRI